MAAGARGRSPTARRVWIWLDASDPREAAALAAYDRIQSTLPRRVRSTLLRDLMIRGLAEIERAMGDAGDPADVVELIPAPATGGRKRGRPKQPREATAETKGRQVSGDRRKSGPVEKPVEAAAPAEPDVPAAGEPPPPGLMW